jgi:hypothetical protein
MLLVEIYSQKEGKYGVLCWENIGKVSVFQPACNSLKSLETIPIIENPDIHTKLLHQEGLI